MLRLRPYKSCDAEYVVKWVTSEEEFVRWSVNFVKYPLTAEGMRIIEDSNYNDEKSWLFIALDEKGIPVGFFAMQEADYENSSVYLSFVIIDSTQRNKGYGKQMMKLALKYAFEILGVSKVTLKVFDNNPNAHKCYQDIGFSDVKHWEKTYEFKNERWGYYDMVINKKLNQ